MNSLLVNRREFIIIMPFIWQVILEIIYLNVVHL